MSVTEHLKRLLLKDVCLDFCDEFQWNFSSEWAILEKKIKSNSRNFVSYHPVLEKEPGSMDHQLQHEENCSEAISRALFSR